MGQGRSSGFSQLWRLFAYDIAADHGCPLLYVGDDFAQTDIKAALDWSGIVPAQADLPGA